MELQPDPVAATEPGKGGFSRLRLEAHGCAPNLPHNFQLITPILPLPSGKKDASARLPRSPVHAKQNDASLPHSETDRRRPMNRLRRPAVRWEGTQASEIDGSRPAELDAGIGGVLSVETHWRVATGNTKSREVAGALAGTAPSSTARKSVTRPEVLWKTGRAT